MFDNNLKVSIVLPTYNGSDTLDKSIESVLNQTYSNWELVLVDDCSSDDTGAIIDRYANDDARIVAIHNKENQKLPQSLNIGFKKTTGIFRTWTSDDNMYHRDALEKMVQYLLLNKDIDMVYADMNIMDEDGRFLLTSERDEPDTLRFVNVVGACFMYRTAIGDLVGEYDPDMFLAEDYEYWIRIYLKGKVAHLPYVLYDYGKTEKSLTATRKEEIQLQTFRVKNKYKQDLLATCRMQKEKNRFYIEMIKLIPDKREKKRIRKKYYKENRMFFLGDISYRTGQFLRNCHKDQ